MALENHIVLRNGVRMPILGMGTTHNGGYNHEAVVHGLRDCGVRLIDTAKRYGTEVFVGQAVVDSGVDRDDVFLATKLWPGDYGAARAPMALTGSLSRMQVDHIDLFLMHWPKCRDGVDRKRCLQETWRILELELDSGRCRSIGVSNFLECDLECLAETASLAPHVNQCEFHPLQNPTELRRYCAEEGIQFQGYCPLGKGLLLGEPEVLEASRRLRVTPAQVLIRWSAQSGAVTIPKSTRPGRVAENAAVLGERFALDEAAMAALDGMHLTRPSKKLVKRDRVTSITLEEDALGRPGGKADGYKLRAEGVNNVFPASMPVFA